MPNERCFFSMLLERIVRWRFICVLLLLGALLSEILWRHPAPVYGAELNEQWTDTKIRSGHVPATLYDALPSDRAEPIYLKMTGTHVPVRDFRDPPELPSQGVDSEVDWSREINIGMLEIAQMHGAEAALHLTKANDIATKLDADHQCLSLLRLGSFYNTQNNLKAAQSLFEKMIEVDNGNTSIELLMRSSAFTALSKTYTLPGNPLSLEKRQKGENLWAEYLKREPKYLSKVEVLRSTANKNWNANRPSDVYKSILVTCRLKGERLDCLHISRSSGSAIADGAALKAISMASQTLSSLPANETILTLQFNAPNLTHDQTELALKATLSDLDRERVGNDPRRTNAIVGMGILQRLRNNRESAKQYFDQALSFAASKPVDPFLLAEINYQLAIYYDQYKEYPDALNCLEKSLEYSKAENLDDEYKKALELKGNILMRSSKTEESLKCFDELAKFKLAHPD